MKIRIIPCLQDNYSYLIIDEKKNIACVVDPSEADPIIEVLENNKIKLEFILNTHHHYDHVGGNIELKKKYNSKIIGFRGDKNRIPKIDILVDDNQNWAKDDFEIKIYHIPGHTSGHICYYFSKEKMVFTGDTLFSLGCGKIFEGTHLEMLKSLNLIKKLPIDTQIYCGHEYTQKNLDFCIKYEINNNSLKEKKKWILSRLSQKQPTIPVTIKEELKTNIFLRCDNYELKKSLDMKNSTELEVFKKLRDLKDIF